MDKAAIKSFAVNARRRLIDSVKDKAGTLGITEEECKNPIQKGEGFEVYETEAGIENKIYGEEIIQRRNLVRHIKEKGYDNVIEEVSYTWFNRIIAIRFMEVNDYLPTKVRVLSSEIEGKIEPDIINEAPDIDLDFTEKDIEYILELKSPNKMDPNILDKLFRFLFVKQCHKLGEILPQLFKKTKDYTEMLLNISYKNKDDVVRMLVDNVPECDFDITTSDEDGKVQGQVEIIGWLYQYYNTELKAKVDSYVKKGNKVKKEDIPAKTQLFTPDWIVKYMVENSLGRLWIEHLRAVDDSVDEKKIAEGFGWKYYLSEAEQEEEVNIQLAQIRKSYLDLTPQDISCIDPCMGSGHILIYMFDVLMDIYKSEGYSERDAAFYIIENNINGLDIDERAHQLAYFAVMMKGRSYNRRFFAGRKIEQEGKTLQVYSSPNLYAIEESNSLPEDLVEQLDNTFNGVFTNDDLNCIQYVIDVFKDAKEYGSILNVDSYTDRQYENIRLKLLSLKNGTHEYYINNSLNLVQMGLINEIFSKLDNLLIQSTAMIKKYTIVITNPPYMGSRKDMNPNLKKYVEKNYRDSKSDLYTCFIEKCLDFSENERYVAMITMQSFMFTDDYKELREKLLTNHSFINMAHLGADAFPEISGEVVQTTIFILGNRYPNNYIGRFVRLVDYACCDKPLKLKKTELQYYASCHVFDNIKAKPISYWLSEAMRHSFDIGVPFEEYGVPRQGIATGENDRFLRFWYEVDINKIGFGTKDIKEFHSSRCLYIPYNKGGLQLKWYGNNDYVIKFDKRNYNILAKQGNHLPSRQYYCHECITWSDISGRTFAARYCKNGFVFDVKGSCAFPDSKNIWVALAFLNSKLTPKYIESLNPTTTTQVGDLKRIPIILPSEEDKVKIDILSQKCVNLAKNDWDSYETSWDFVRHPLLNGSTLLQEAYEYWHDKCSQSFEALIEFEEAINAIFIDIYGLSKEIGSDVAWNSINLRVANKTKDIKTLISYAIGCMFGRYSLDEDGLIYAGGEFDISRYKTFNVSQTNILPITDEEYFSDDIVKRFVEFVRVVYGEETLEENLKFIADALGNKGSSSRDIIRNYFIKDFYKDHFKIYQKRPIYWLFDSGKENGFKALIYMHRYDKDTVGRVRTEYLHKTQTAIENAIMRAEHIVNNSTNEREKAQATKDKNKYIKQIAETRMYDEAIAHIANQRIEIDLDDGVKVNYEKFQGVEIAQEGKKTVKIDLLAKIK